MKICNICNEVFKSGRSFSNHIRWKHKKIEYKRTTCTHCQQNIRNENYKRHTVVCAMNPINTANCKECGTTIIGYRKKFCNHSCSAKYSNANRDEYDRSYMTPEWREKQRQKTIEQWNKGVHKLNRTIFSSKNERAITKYFRENFLNDEWKTGGRLVLSDGSFLSRDLWSDKLKICFEYDGIWHFKDIKGQLQKKQLKDKLLEEWCVQNKYRLIRIDEKQYRNIDQIVNLIYHCKDNIIKIGDNY